MNLTAIPDKDKEETTLLSCHVRKHDMAGWLTQLRVMLFLVVATIANTPWTS